MGSPGDSNPCPQPFNNNAMIHHDKHGAKIKREQASHMEDTAGAWLNFPQHTLVYAVSIRPMLSAILT